MSNVQPTESQARFHRGQRVRIHDRHPGVHHRVPRYVKGQEGTVERVCGLHGQPETFVRGDGRPATRLYRICIPQAQLWPGYQGPDDDSLEVEVFEHWLEPA
ncbi:MAG: SH3-like domain-containing protein [Pseudomonadota bacterium]